MSDKTEPVGLTREAPAWLASARLWLVLDSDACGASRLEWVTARAIEGGVDAVMLRLKDLPDPVVVERGLPVREVCAAQSVPLVVSHCLAAAEPLRAEGFHTGMHGPGLAQARRHLGPATALGYSAHSAAECYLAAEHGADYLFLGPMYDTPSKRAYGLPPGPLLLEATRDLGLPRIGIGGITPARVPQLIEASASGIAVISWICTSADPRGGAGQLKEQLLAATSRSCG